MCLTLQNRSKASGSTISTKHQQQFTKRLIILDRDGVINYDSELYIKGVEEWIPIPGSLNAIARLCRANYSVVIATNQSGIGRGYFNIDALNSIHCRMREKLLSHGVRVEAVFFCPHRPDQNCGCRKPRPGLLESIAQRMNFDLVGVPFVGDSIGDVQAATAMGSSPLLVLTGKGQKTVKQFGASLIAVPIYRDLASVVDDLL